MKAAILLVLILIAGGIGYNIYEKEQEKQQIAKAEERAAQVQESRRLIDEQWDDSVNQAILDHKVIKGMTGYEVTKAWSRCEDKRNYDIPASWHDAGVYEIWVYDYGDKGALGMSVNGEVFIVSKPQ